MQPKNAICLWYDGTALDAATFYANTFADSSVGEVYRAPADYPSGNKGDVLTVQFTVLGIPCLGLNGGPEFKHSEAFSFQVATDDQQETDRLWQAIVGNGGQASACGWCKDKWGLSWQITPRVLIDAITDPNPEAARRAFEAMMTMEKIDIAVIEAAQCHDAPSFQSDVPSVGGLRGLRRRVAEGARVRRPEDFGGAAALSDPGSVGAGSTRAIAGRWSISGFNCVCGGGSAVVGCEARACMLSAWPLRRRLPRGAKACEGYG